MSDRKLEALRSENSKVFREVLVPKRDHNEGRSDEFRTREMEVSLQ